MHTAGRSKSSAWASVATVIFTACLATSCTREIASGLDESEANRAVVTLSRAGIDAQKSADPAAEGRFRVVVGRDEATLGISVLASEDLPKTRALPAKEQSFIASPEAERRGAVSAVAMQVERSLGSIDGVLDARVHLDVPVIDPLVAAIAPSGAPGAALKPTASVLLRHRGVTPPVSIDDVRRLVAGAVSGLSSADVAVVLVAVPGPSLWGDREMAHLGPVAVARTSLATLRLIALSVMFAIALLGATIAMLSMRLRRQGESAGAARERARD